MSNNSVDVICGIPLSVTGILKQACLLTGFKCHFIFDTAQHPLHGGENIIFVVEDAKHSRFAIRVPRLEEPYAGLVVKAEALHRQAIEDRKIGRIQKMLAFSTSNDNPIKAPFIALKWAEGIRSPWTDSEPAQEKDRRKIIHAIAHFSMDLLGVQQRGIIWNSSGD